MVAISTGRSNHRRCGGGSGQEHSIIADMWKAQRLPTPSQKEARKQWVEKAMEDASAILRQMHVIQQQEQRSTKESSSDSQLPLSLEDLDEKDDSD